MTDAVHIGMARFRGVCIPRVPCRGWRPNLRAGAGLTLRLVDLNPGRLKRGSRDAAEGILAIDPPDIADWPTLAKRLAAAKIILKGVMAGGQEKKKRRSGFCGGGMVLAALLSGMVFATPVYAQQATDVCLKSGSTVRVSQIEIVDGGFVMHLVGGVEMRVATDAIKTFGQACSNQPAVVESRGETFAIWGSNTIGERLMPALIDAYSRSKLHAPAKFIPTAPEEQKIELRTSASADPAVTIDFKANGSATSFPALLQSQIEIGMASRRIKDEEGNQFRDRYNIKMTNADNEHVLGLDGTEIIVNSGNPIRNLGIDEIAKIFSCQVTNWSEVRGTSDAGEPVAGPDLPIAVLARDDKSGTFDTFKNLVLGHLTPAATLCGNASRYEDSEELSAAVAKIPGAVGFVRLPYTKQNHALGIVDACGLTTLPTNFAVKTEQYALTRRLYLYTVGLPHNSYARELLAYSLSDEAQAVVKQQGFTDQSVEFAGDAEQFAWVRGVLSNPNGYLPVETPVPQKATQAFRAASANLKRSSVAFRFEYASSDLDALAVQNVVRLKRFLENQNIRANSVWIFGFADSTGGWESNVRVSLARAEVVAGKLADLGMAIPAQHIVPFSYMAPVACNDNEAARAKNRRVEVWIAR